MNNLDFSQYRKKFTHVGVKLSFDDRQILQQFCNKEQISFSDFFRTAIREIAAKNLKK